ncbi:MAG: metallophosphoesterase [Gemmataceae bacterium]
MRTHTLVQPLLDGPIDVVGDVHGEIDGLRGTARRLGYDARGRHPHDRRLVFVGDLGDRGPDSPAVVEWVRDLVDAGRGQCVLGNHDFNALYAAAGGEMKPELSWLFAEAAVRPPRHPGPQALVRGTRRDDILGVLRPPAGRPGAAAETCRSASSTLAGTPPWSTGCATAPTW